MPGGSSAAGQGEGELAETRRRRDCRPEADRARRTPRQRAEHTSRRDTAWSGASLNGGAPCYFTCRFDRSAEQIWPIFREWPGRNGGPILIASRMGVVPGVRSRIRFSSEPGGQACTCRFDADPQSIPVEEAPIVSALRLVIFLDTVSPLVYEVIGLSNLICHHLMIHFLR